MQFSRKTFAAGAGALTALTLAVPSAGASTTSTTQPAHRTTSSTASTTPSAHHTTSSSTTAPGATKGWEVTAGKYKTQAAATKRVRTLRAKGVSGFTVEHEAKQLFDAEQTVASKKAAQKEQARLRKLGFTAHIERA